MKNKLKKVFVYTMFCTALFTFPSNAAETNNMIKSENAQQEETILLPVGVESSKDVMNGVERSSIISSASSEIIDETGGNIGVIIDTFCHVECNEIRNIAILDRYDEETQTWEELARYDFRAVKEDFPNEPLTFLTNSFTIENQETGYYYRIRGIHSVTTTDNKGQVYSTRTSGLLITEYGR